MDYLRDYFRSTPPKGQKSRTKQTTGDKGRLYKPQKAGFYAGVHKKDKEKPSRFMDRSRWRTPKSKVSLNRAVEGKPKTVAFKCRNGKGVKFKCGKKK